MKRFTSYILAILISPALLAAEFHVAPSGNDGHDGTSAMPFKTISAAALKAMPGDTITVHAGTYRERIDPPRGGASDAKRITYQAAPGGKVVITGSEPAKGWEKVSGDTWKLSLPSSGFGNFNPYVDRIRGDWFNPNGRVHHTGCVYLNGDWMIEANNLDEVMKPAGKTPLWFATVEGDTGEALVNIAWFKPGKGPQVSAGEPSFRYGSKPAPCSEGGTCTGFILNGHWLRFDGVDFGTATDSVEFRTASIATASLIELRLDHPEGELLGTCNAGVTGDWQKWQSFTAKIKPTSGRKNLCLIFKTPLLDTGKTTILAQFPGGVNPNEAAVEINRRQTVFYPSKNFINHITVRGFTIENAATNWAPPSSEQMGAIGTNWSKGWIIENNTVRHSKCSGIALGKYGDGTDNTNDDGEADPYTACVRRALANGWNKATIGSHIVRNNHIYHCEQTGIVGSMGAVFCTVTGNEIHDIYVRKLFSGAEMAGMKFHAAVDTEISGNHIYRVGGVAGIWLDWMAQGTRVTRNLMHDNGSHDIFVEVNHGPFLIANNILLSGQSIRTWSNGGAYVHNIIAGALEIRAEPGRQTPFLVPHGVDIAGLKITELGDDRFINNIVSGGSLAPYDNAALPVRMEGNVFVNKAIPSKQEAAPWVNAAFDPVLQLTRGNDGSYHLAINTDTPWGAGHKRPLVTTDLLGKATLPNQAYELPDGSPLKIDSDYFGKPRDPANPFPGPFEIPACGPLKLKVWPQP
jgi:hypothetical protein